MNVEPPVFHTPLVRKLEQFTRLSPDERRAIDEAAGARVHRLEARRDVIREGDRPEAVNLILKGWACRYKLLPDGRRQIAALLLPGDLCDLNVYILSEMDHSIGALTPLTYAEITRDAFDRLVEGHPRIMQALWWDALVTVAVQREWTTNVAQRSSFERMAHLLCELFHRLRAVGLVENNSCHLPLTQAELADALGMTPVHANRTIRELRERGLLRLEAKRLTLIDLPGLERASMFNPNYLHLGREGRRLDANAG